MKKFLLFFAFLFIVPSMLIFSDDNSSYSTYTIKKIEVNSSSDNPGKLNVSTSFEKKDTDGKITKDSKNEVVDVSGYDGYKIKMNDNDAGYSIEEPSFEDRQVSMPRISDFDDMFSDRIRRNNQMIQRMRENMERISNDSFYSAPKVKTYTRPVKINTRKKTSKKITIPRLFFLF